MNIPALILPPGALRLLLAALVVWSHFASLAKSPLYTPLEGVSVCGFFFLSGYWVANLWKSRYARCRAPLLTFYASRVMRIYPQATIATLVMLALIGASLQHLAWNVSLFAVQFGGAINPPAWSLAIELQFYVLAPLLFIVLRNWIVAIAVLALGMFFFVRFSLGLTGSYVYHFIVPFALGIIYSYAPRHDLAARLAPYSLLAILVFGVATNLEIARPLIPLDYSSNDVRRLTVMFFHIISLPFIAASLSIRSGQFDRGLGDLAYPVYLLHWPMFVLATMMTPVAVVPLALLLTMVSSFLVFWFVDRPLEARRHQFVARRMAPAGGAAFLSGQPNSQASPV